MRIFTIGPTVLSLTGCLEAAPPSESQLASELTARSIPTTTGSFQGSYVVPVPANLASAAAFRVPEVSWTVTAGVATLHYDLPVGLVGGDISITLSGALPAGASTVQLSGSAGTGSCTASSTVITCSERFQNLGALPINTAVVEQMAAVEFSGPVSSRVAVAGIFGSDPIGTVDFDLAVPSDDDGGGGGGGGGGNSGPGGGHGGGGGGGGGGHGPH